MAWTPNGAELAVIYGRKPYIEILGAKDLARRAVPDLSEMDRERLGEIYSICFSAKGDRLLAGGRYSRGKTIVRVWEQNGVGKFTDLQTSTNTIFDLKTLDDGSLIFGAADPAWGRIGVDNRVRPSRPREISTCAMALTL